MHARLALVLTIVVLGLRPSSVHAEIIYETAAAGSVDPTAGVLVRSSGFLAVNFHVPVKVRTGRIGGYFQTEGKGEPIFGAIVAIDAALDFPNPRDLSGADVLGATLISPPERPGGDVSGNLRLTLQPGWYALVFGTGRFGAVGEASAVRHTEEVGNPRPYTIRQSDGQIIFQAMILRLFVDSEPAPVFTRIVDEFTLIPGTSFAFTSFGFPAIHEGVAAFRGMGPESAGPNRRGLYRWKEGTLTQLANVNLFSPFLGGVQSFGIFASIRRGHVVDYVGGMSGERLIARFSEESIQTVADTNTKIPFGEDEFSNLGNMPAADGPNAAFTGTGLNGQQGVYKAIDGVLYRVADTNTSIPGGIGNFEIIPLQYVSIDQGYVAFRGGSATVFQFGIYTDLGGSLKTVADLDTSIPGGKANFGFLGTPHLRRGKFAFGGADIPGAMPNEIGYYADVSGTLAPVADLTTPVPGGTGTFSSFSGDGAFDGQHMAFIGVDSMGRRGLHTDLTGRLTKVIAEGETLDGRVVDGLFIGFEAIDDYRVAFSASFDDDTGGLYVARYPAAPGDLDGEGDVDLKDVSQWIDQFGTVRPVPLEPDHGVADVNGDRDVDFDDWKTIAGCLGGPERASACAP